MSMAKFECRMGWVVGRLQKSCEAVPALTWELAWNAQFAPPLPISRPGFSPRTA